MTNRIAVVTGGRRGIGRAIAFALAEAAHDVVLVDSIEDEATQQTLDGLARRSARARFIQADIADVVRAADLAGQCFNAFGSVDVLVNNAGVQVQDRAVDALHTTVESFDRLMNVNLRGTFFLTQAVARRMMAAPGGSFRSIVTISE